MAIHGGAVMAYLDLNTGRFDSALQEAKKRGDEWSSGVMSTGSKLTRAGTALTLGLTAPIVGFGVGAVNSAIKFESAFAGVRKTVDATEGEFAVLNRGIRDMTKELPASADEIARVAESAGQLGIQTPNILSFTRTMTDLGVATNMSSDQAATALARLANITGMPQTQFDRLGSTVVALGNNLATTESEIVDMSLRLAGAGTQAGMTEAEIMAMAGALSSVGIEAQAGGTAMSRVISQIQVAVETGNESLEDFADVAGMSTEQFKKAFQDNAMGALQAFIGGLATSEERGKSAIVVLEEMGITEIRLRDALLRSSSAVDIWNDSVDLANRSWKENTALTKEAEERYKTTESKIQLMKNSIAETSRTMGEALLPTVQKGVDWVGNLAGKFSELSEEQRETILKTGGFLAALGPATSLVGNVTKGVGLLSSGLGKAGPIFSSFATNGISALTSMMNPVGLAVGAIGLLTGGVIALGLAMDAARDGSIQWGDDISEANQRALNSYIELEQDALVAISGLSIGHRTVTDEDVTYIGGKYNEMKNVVVGALNEMQEKGQTTVSELFQGTELEEQGAEYMHLLQNQLEERQKRIESYETGIQHILETASKERRGLTEEEARIVVRNTRLMQKEAGEVLTQGQKDMNRALVEAGNARGKIEREMMDSLLELGENLRDERIEQAEEAYDRQMEVANMLKTGKTQAEREAGEEIEREARKTYLKQLNIARQTNAETVQELNKMAGEVKYIYDAKNNEIISVEEMVAKFQIDNLGMVNKTAEELIREYAEKTGQSYEALTGQIIDASYDLVEGFNQVTKGTGKATKTFKDQTQENLGGVAGMIETVIDKIKKLNSTKIQDKSATFKITETTTRTAVTRAYSMAYASGTDYAVGGMALVGEQGPELVQLPRGSRVFPNDRTQSMMEIDYDRLGQAVASALENADIRASSYIDGREITDHVSEAMARRTGARSVRGY